MEEIQDVGRLLDKPRMQMPKSSPVFETAFYLLLVLLGGFGALCCLQTAFSLPIREEPLVLAGVLASLTGVCGFTLPWPKARWILLALCALALGASMLLFSEECVEGCSRLLNLILQAYSDKLHFPLRQFQVPATRPSAIYFTCTTFCQILLPPYFWLLAWVLVKRKNGIAAFCITGAVLCVPLAVSIVPAFWALCMLLLFWCMLLLSSTILGRRHRLLDEKVRFLISSAAVRPAALALLAGVVVCMALLYRLFPEDTYQRPQAVNDLRTGITNGFGLDAVLQGGQGSSNDRVSLEGLGSREYTGKTVLRVKFDWQEGAAAGADLQPKEYLKSFAGSEYTGSSWERLSKEGAAALRDFCEPGDVQAFPSAFSRLVPGTDALMGLQQASSLDSPYSYALSVENVAANPRCVYIPYGVSGSVEEWAGKGIEAVDDGFFQSKNIFSGTRDYLLNSVGLPAGTSYAGRVFGHWMGRINNDASYLEAYLADEHRRAAFTNSGMDIWTVLRALLDSQADYKAPAWAKEPLGREGRELLDTAEAYEDFALEQYLQVPESLAPLLGEFREKHGLTFPEELAPGNYVFEYPDFLGRLAGLFQLQYSYSLSPPALPQGRDFVEYFLNDSRTGYCVHFATAAVLLCRSAGIPARYAEGYAVPSGKSGVWQDVPDRNAHAWLEVYYNGTGWLPVEVTPASMDAPAAYYDARPPAIEGNTATPPPEDAPSQAEADITPTPRPTGAPTAGPTPSIAPGSVSPGQEEEGRPLTPLLLACAGLVALLLAAGLANRFLHKYLRKKAFSQEDRSKAALCLYAHLLKLHREEAKIYYGERKPPARWEELALKARFAKGMLPLDELQELASDAASLEASLKAELPTASRLRCQYLLGLF